MSALPTTPPQQPSVPASNAIPPLKDGDRLTRDEFERRYDAMPHLKKAELIEGVVYMPSPVRVGHHASPHLALATWTGTYWVNTPGVQAGVEASIRLDLNNEPQPDVVLFILPSHGGQALISADDYVEGAPEWVGEVAASSASIDLNAKFRAYQRNGVREYLVWRVPDRVIEWFALRDNRFISMPPSEDGILRSEVFPGLWLDPAALIGMDLARMMRVLQLGIESPDHAAFVEQIGQHTAH